MSRSQDEPKIANLLKNREKQMWQGCPVLVPFVLSSWSIMLFGFVWLAIPTSMIFFIEKQATDMNDFGKIGFQIFLIPFFLLGIMMLLGPIYKLLVHKFVKYVITDQRIIIMGGLIGRDIKVFNFENIRNIAVEVGVIDKIYGTGCIKFFTGEIESSGTSAASRYDVFVAIDKPYEVFKIAQEAIDTYQRR